MKMADSPQHVAIIMDGNGRWARSRGLPRPAGHRASVKVVRKVVEECAKRNVGYLTLFAFSSSSTHNSYTTILHYGFNICEVNIHLHSNGDNFCNAFSSNGKYIISLRKGFAHLKIAVNLS